MERQIPWASGWLFSWMDCFGHAGSRPPLALVLLHSALCPDCLIKYTALITRLPGGSAMRNQICVCFSLPFVSFLFPISVDRYYW